MEEDKNVLLKHDGDGDVLNQSPSKPFCQEAAVRALLNHVSLSEQCLPVGGALLLYLVSFPLVVLIRKSPFLYIFYKVGNSPPIQIPCNTVNQAVS